MCPFCQSSSYKETKLPDNNFNGKRFTVLKCTNCNLNFINPIPDTKDLELMYPPSYQQGVEVRLVNLEKKLPGLRFSYKKILTSIKQNKSELRILDFGCGTGLFVYNALNAGYKVEGVEFSSEQVRLLREKISGSNFYTVDEFSKSSEKYDVIYLSNVFEHFTDCKAEFINLLSHLDVKGKIIVEGPIEMNSSLVNYFKWLYLRMRKALNKNFKTTYSPVHIFYSNAKNQKMFFENCGIKTVSFETSENSWPYPENLIQVNGFSGFVKYCIAKLSKALIFIIPNFGNTFLYVGEKI